MAISMAKIASSIVAGSRIRKTWKASSPGSTAVEAPNSPWAAREMNAVLDVDRLVEAERRLERSPARGGGAFAEDRGDGATGQRAEPDEQEEGQHEQDADHLEQPTHDESEHVSVLTPCGQW